MLIMLPFVVAHLITGVDLQSFIVSHILLFTAYVFALTAYTFFNNYDRLAYIFKMILVINFVLVLIAICLFFTPWAEILWHFRPLTKGISEFPRLNMLTYEPSYYSLLMVPLAGYFGLRLIRGEQMNNKGWIAAMILIPLLLSFSMGVISTLIIAATLVLLGNPRDLLFEKKTFNWVAGILMAGLSVLLLMFLFFPENVLFHRLYNILTGNDPSAQGRLSDAFWLSWELLGAKEQWFGEGVGQIKVIAKEYIIEYYNYNPAEFPTVRIPNAMAETLVSFGIIGVVLRLGVQIHLFFKTKVYSNYFRSLMFFFVFIYQFTGSYLTNIAEYVIWALAFSYCFPQLDKPKKVNS